MRDVLDVSERRVCRLLGQPRSTQSYNKRIADDEEILSARIVALASPHGRYSYRRVTAILRHEGWQVNHKRVERIWRREELKMPRSIKIRLSLFLAITFLETYDSLLIRQWITVIVKVDSGPDPISVPSINIPTTSKRGAIDTLLAVQDNGKEYISINAGYISPYVLVSCAYFT